MQNSYEAKENYLEPTIKAAQYLSGLTVYQNVWAETSKVMVNFFNSDFAFYANLDQNGDIHRHDGAFKSEQFKAKIDCYLLEKNRRMDSSQTLKKGIQDGLSEVLSSCFFSWKTFDKPEKLAIAFLPINIENDTQQVLLIGQRNNGVMSKKLLNVYLAISRLINTNITRILSERELRKHRNKLEEQVNERTQLLTRANKKLQREIDERKQAQEKVNDLLKEKSLILKESHHRIKNNMYMIYGLLFMQSEKVKNKTCKTILMDSANRIQSMMVLYDKLYRSEKHHSMKIKDYLEPLMTEILSLYTKTRSIEYVVEIDDFMVPADPLANMGIILTELITNSFKYAFVDGQPARITLNVKKENHQIIMMYENSGKSIPEDFKIETSSGFGMELISMLIRQFHGDIKIVRKLDDHQLERGTRFIITLTV